MPGGVGRVNLHNVKKAKRDRHGIPILPKYARRAGPCGPALHTWAPRLARSLTAHDLRRDARTVTTHGHHLLYPTRCYFGGTTTVQLEPGRRLTGPLGKA